VHACAGVLARVRACLLAFAACGCAHAWMRLVIKLVHASRHWLALACADACDLYCSWLYMLGSLRTCARVLARVCGYACLRTEGICMCRRSSLRTRVRD
jgi:hypothetical protein